MEDHLGSTNTESDFEMGVRSSVLEGEVSEGCAEMHTENSRNCEAGANVKLVVETPLRDKTSNKKGNVSDVTCMTDCDDDKPLRASEHGTCRSELRINPTKESCKDPGNVEVESGCTNRDSVRIVDPATSNDSCDNVNNPNSLKYNELYKVRSRQLMRNVGVKCISEQEACQENLQVQNPSECPSKLNNNIALESPLVAAQIGSRNAKNERNINCPEQRNCEMKGDEFSTVVNNIGDQFSSAQTKCGEVKKNGVFPITGEEEKKENSYVSVSEVTGIIQNKLHEPDDKLLDNSRKENGEPENGPEQLALKTSVDESSGKRILESRNNVLENSQMSVQVTPKKSQEKKYKGVSLSQDCQRKKSVFQRGLFPRIVLRNSDAKTGRWLGRQLFQKRATRDAKSIENEDACCSFEGDKKEKRSNKKLGMHYKLPAENNFSNLRKKMKCSNKEISPINDVQLKCLRVSLRKIDESELINYSVHLPHSQSCVGDNDKLNDSLSSFKTDESNDKNTKLVPQVVFEPDNADDEQMLDLQLIHNMQDSAKHNGEKRKNSGGATELCVEKSVSDSRGTNKISGLENSADALLEKENALLDSAENVNESKRRLLEEANKPSIKKQKQLSPYESMLKKARVHILKIDNAVLSKYGYDSQMLKTVNTALVSGSSTTDSSTVTSGRDTRYSWKIYNGNNQNLLNRSFKKHSVKMDVHSVTSCKMKRRSKFVSKRTKDYMRRGTVVPLSRCLSSQKLQTLGGAKGKGNCINLKIAQVILRRIEDVPLSNYVVPKKLHDLSLTEPVGERESGVQSDCLNLTPVHEGLRNIEDSPLSCHVLLKEKSIQSTAKPLNRTEGTIQSDCINLETAEDILRDAEDMPLSSRLLSKKLRTQSTPKTMSGTKRTIGIAKADSNVFSMELAQGRLSSKKQIVFDQTKFCENIQKGKEKTRKRNGSSCEGNMIVNDCSKENVCLNGESVYLKCARVSLCKLDNLTVPKFLSSDPVVLKT